jgi:hypothetical protein
VPSWLFAHLGVVRELGRQRQAPYSCHGEFTLTADNPADIPDLEIAVNNLTKPAL